MRISVVTAAAFVAMMTLGCGSSTNSTGTPAAGTDTGAQVDSGTPADTTTADTTAQADTNVQVDTGPVDTGPVDTGPVDTGPPAKQKCVQTGNPQADNACLQQCAMVDCADQVASCGSDINCGKILGCLNDCEKKPPVELPGEATWTCNQKCYFTYGESATDKFVGQNLCVLSQCLKGNYTKPCAGNVLCQNYCIMDECDAEVMECLNEPACVGFFSCLNSQCVDPATQQACATTCNEGLIAKHGQAAAQKAQLAYTGIMLCGQSKCQ